MRKATTLTFAALLLAVVWVPAGAGAQVATMNFSSAAVTWAPQVENNGITLTVAGGGVWFQREFGASESPRFDTYDSQGNPLADGVYKWELRAMPAHRSGDRTTNSRTSDDGMYVAYGSGPRIEPQSGTFRILNGALVDPSAAEGVAAATSDGSGFAGGGGGGRAVNAAGDGPVTYDQVILDDLIVDGSICAGLDCVNGESFGFDTLRLKENNLRIKFQDTSSSASFPTNDWQITVNDSSNGGANKFSIDDIDGGRTPFTIEAGAPSHSLFVDDGGRIGLGTNTPVVEVHVKDGDTPTVRLEQDGTSGFTPQIWDLAGNETNFFVRDVTNGSKLPLRIRPDAGSNSIYVDTDGEVCMNCTSPLAQLHVQGNARVVQTTATTAAFRMVHSDQSWQFQNNGTSDDFEIRDVSAALTPFKIENGTPSNFFTLTAAGQVEVNGTPVHPDYVFEPDYELESIEQHSEYMFANKHLPAVGAGRYGEDGRAKLDLIGRSQGVLEELEKAHIYIAQLNEQIKLRESEIEGLNDRAQARDAQLDELLARLARLEATISPR